MRKKNGEVSFKGVAAYSYRQLNKVNALVEELESNAFKRLFNKKAIEMLKDCWKFIEKSIERDKSHLAFKELSGMHSSEVDEIVKKNKSLEKEIKKGKELWYLSKREENHLKQKRWRWRPRKPLFAN